MKTLTGKYMLGAAVAAAVVSAVVVMATRSSVAAQTASPAANEAPRFEVDRAWPNIPNGWVLGQVASAAADDQNNIWVLHRPRTVRPDQKTGPPVMEFDSAGHYLQGWGGAGTGYDWPQSEHGI